MDSLTNFTTQNGGVWTSDFHSHPVTPSIEKHRAFMEEVAWTEISVGRVHGNHFVWQQILSQEKKITSFVWGGTKTMGLPHHLDVFYHLDASINFLPTTSALFQCIFFQPLAKLKLVVVSVVTKEWHRLESGHSADWYPNITHTIHVWYIHLHLVNFYGFHVGKYTIHGSYGLQRHEHVVHESCHNDTFQHPEGTLNTWVSDWLPRRPHPAALQSWFKAICRNKADLKHNYISTNS